MIHAPHSRPPRAHTIRSTCLAFAISVYVPVAAAAADDVRPHAGMLRYPDVSATHIAFVYANDVWIVPREGGTAKPLASPPGPEMFPRFSPDGKTIAFMGNYDGNRDIYTIPVEGGIPTRVTHHPAGEFLSDWTPDGRLIFHMSGLGGLTRQTQLFTVSAQGGMPEQLPVPYGANGTISPDGRWLAYTPHSRDFRTWKRYRGGMATNIWLFNLEDHSSHQITDWEGTDTQPMWHGETVYYLSDAGPEHRLNIWSYDTRTGERRQITSYDQFDVKWPSIGPGPRGDGEIVFQLGADLYLLDLRTRRARTVEVTIPGARPTIRPRRFNAADHIQSWEISPTGQRAVVQARGDVWTLPAEHGSPRNLTRTSGIAERDPSWSPDARWIAYFSDETGEYELYIRQSDGRGEARQLTNDDGPFKYSPTWSPDSNYIHFWDKTGAMFLADVESGEIRHIDTDPWASRSSISWSHDSRWIAYTRTAESNRLSSIWLYDVENDQRHQLTSDMFSDRSPAFDRKGDHLYFVSSRSFSPMYGELDTSFIYAGTQVILAVPLRDDMASPWAPKSDEETWKDEEEEEDPEKEEAEPTPDEHQEHHNNNAGEHADDGVSGVWEGTVTGPEPLPPGGINFSLTLALAADNSLSGSLWTPMGTADITSGSFDRATGAVSFTLRFGDIAIEANGTIRGESITGRFTLPDQGVTADFSGARTKPAAARANDEPDEDEKKEEKPKEHVEIDIDGFERRAMILPISSGNFGALAVNDRNQLIYGRNTHRGGGGTPAIHLFDITDDKKEERTVATGTSSFRISADGKKLLVIRGSRAAIQNAAAGATATNVVTAGMNVMIDPREEWEQLFTDAWRIQRDFFYVDNLHDVDWEGVRDHYRRMLADCVSREDVSYVISEMISELNVGHAYYWGGDVEPQPGTSVAMLGCDYELADDEDGNTGYRISRIYEGAPWDADARGPLSQPGVDVSEGDFLLAVNGVPVDTDLDPWAAFQGKGGRAITITVSEKAVWDDDARDVVVEPLSGDTNLRYRAWIEANRAYVEKKTDGRVGYIYVPNTGVQGQNELIRQFYGQIGKEGLIIDERWNGGGQIPTRFIELLNRPRTNYWARRDGKDWPWPPDSHQGPKTMLINGLAGSGGDMFPALFRQMELGKLIGTRTWGGLVGISGNPGLIDGGYTAVPTFGYYTADGRWSIEGHGVDPDIEVIDDPALMVDGGDPQLDAAIEHILAEIERNPYTPPQRPAPPDRSGFGIDPAHH